MARDQRIKRAFVLNQKKEYLAPEERPDPLQNEYYLRDVLVRRLILLALIVFVILSTFLHSGRGRSGRG